MSDPTATAQALVEVARTHQLKPLLTSFMGEIKVAEGVNIFRNAHVPTFDTPEDAVRAYMYMYQYTRNLANLYETPADILPDFEPRPRRREEDLHRRGALGPRHPHRGRGQAGARGLRDPRGQDPGRHLAPRSAPRPPRRSASRWPSRSSATTSPTRATSAASPSTCARRRRPPTSSPRSSKRVAEAAAEGRPHRRRRAGHVPRRLRGHHRLQEGPHVRPGAHVRHGRHRRGAVPRRGRRLPAAEPGAGAVDDPEHQGQPASWRATAASRRWTWSPSSRRW